jgi:sortase A
MSHRNLKINATVAWLFIIVGSLGIIVSVASYLNEPKPPQIRSVDVNIAPSSIKPAPKTIATYSVPPTYPKYIAIPAIAISNTPIIELGLLKSGAIATPDTIYETGWYKASSKPGQSGAMFIYGHVSSWTADGIFYNLKKLTPGNQVLITRGDNKTFTYQVVSTKIYQSNNVDMQQVLTPVNPGLPGLNLMTCTGKVIKGTSEFTERLVVFTSLVKS